MIKYLVYICIAIIAMGLLRECGAEEVDLAKIAMIESSNNPLAYNAKSQATGMYQITPICLKDFNSYHMNPRHQYELKDMYEASNAYIVASWYINKRIPQLLRHYKLDSNSIENRLIAYNFGIGNLVKYRKGEVKLPKETRDYIKKYNRL